MLDKASVGYYSAALTISTLWSMIPSALIQSISPVLYEAAGKDRALYLRRLRQSYAVLFWLNAAYSIFVGVFAHWVILLLYGKDYLAGTAALRIVVWYYGLSTMSTLNQVYLANDGKNRYINLFCIAGLITDVILNFILIPVIGVYGAALATCISYIAVFMFRVFHTRKYIKYDILYKEFILGSLLMILSAILMFADGAKGFLLQFIVLVLGFVVFSKTWIPILQFFLNKIRRKRVI